MASNVSMKASREAKFDEFYTLFKDVKAELDHYTDKFRGKTIYLPCDDPRWSNFWKYFDERFDEFGLKNLVATCYKDNHVYIRSDNLLKIEELSEPFDLRQPVFIDIAKKCCVTITNPPFSLFRSFILPLVQNKIDFIVWANIGSVTGRELFPYVVEGQVFSGYTFAKCMYFETTPEYDKPDLKYTEKMNDGKTYARISMACVLTSFKMPREYENRGVENGKWKAKDYVRYDSFNAIEIPNINLLPIGYDGNMGVSTTAFGHIDTDKYRIIGMLDKGNGRGYDLGIPSIKGKDKYQRIVIRQKIVP